MRAIGRIAMEKTKLVRHSFGLRRLRHLSMVGTGFLLALALGRSASAQQIPVTGTVTGSSGQPLRGVAVQVQGLTTRAITDDRGRYSITAPSNGSLYFTLLGQRSVEKAIGGQSRGDVEMTPIAFLQEMAVTAYAEQRRADITGDVSTAHVEPVQKQTGASALPRLDV